MTDWADQLHLTSPSRRESTRCIWAAWGGTCPTAGERNTGRSRCCPRQGVGCAQLWSLSITSSPLRWLYFRMIWFCCWQIVNKIGYCSWPEVKQSCYWVTIICRSERCNRLGLRGTTLSPLGRGGKYKNILPCLTEKLTLPIITVITRLLVPPWLVK